MDRPRVAGSGCVGLGIAFIAMALRHHASDAWLLIANFWLWHFAIDGSTATAAAFAGLRLEAYIEVSQRPEHYERD